MAPICQQWQSAHQQKPDLLPARFALFRRLDHQRARHFSLSSGVEAVVHQSLGDVLDFDARTALQ